MRLVQGTSLKHHLQAAKAQLDKYDFSIADKDYIADRLASWNDERSPLDLDWPSHFSYCQPIRRQITDYGLNHAYRLIAVMLLVCSPHYPEVVAYIKKLTKRSRLVEEWHSFETSAAWRNIRFVNGVPIQIPVTAVNLASGKFDKDKPPMNIAVADHRRSSTPGQRVHQREFADGSARTGSFNPPTAPSKVLRLLRLQDDGNMSVPAAMSAQVRRGTDKEEEQTAESVRSNSLAEIVNKSVSPQYPFPILTSQQGRLYGYSPVTTLRPANSHMHLSSPYTLRIGWHTDTGAAILGVLKRNKRWIRMYAAACTLDERPLPRDKVPRKRIRLDSIVLISNFACLDRRTMGDMLREISQSKQNSESELHNMIARLEPSVNKPLRDVAMVSDMAYGTLVRLPPPAIREAAKSGKCTGLYKSFAGQVDRFHRENSLDTPETRSCHQENTAAPTTQTAPEVPHAPASSAVHTLPTAMTKNNSSNADKAHLDQLFEHAQSFVNKYLETFPEKRPQTPQSDPSTTGTLDRGRKRRVEEASIDGVGNEGESESRKRRMRRMRRHSRRARKATLRSISYARSRSAREHRGDGGEPVMLATE